MRKNIIIILIIFKISSCSDYIPTKIPPISNDYNATTTTITITTTTYNNITTTTLKTILKPNGPAGGYIFYDRGFNGGDWRYIEMAPFDQGVDITWCNSLEKNLKTGITNTGIGYGKTNTISLVSILKYSSAANICNSYVLNGYDDWFLPSSEELRLMISYLFENEIFDSDDKYVRYWSSSEFIHRSSDAWYNNQNPVDGVSFVGMKTLLKEYKFRVRAIRYF